MIMIDALIIFQGDLHAHFHSDSALYPDSGFQYDSGLSQGGTDRGLHPHSCLHPEWSSSPQLSTYPDSCSSLSDYTTQSTLLFHVIFISAYPAVRVKLYAYVQ